MEKKIPETKDLSWDQDIFPFLCLPLHNNSLMRSYFFWFTFLFYVRELDQKRFHQ